jgi:hypothetical protein
MEININITDLVKDWKEEIFAYICQCYYPEDVFDEYELEVWATKNGWHKDDENI